MSIQKLSKQHAAQVAEVLASHKSEKDFEIFGLNWSEQQITESLEHLAWGFFDNNKLISFIFFRRVHESLLELDLMVTRKDMLQKSKMKTLFLTTLKELQGHEIWLEVHEKNTLAQNFYLKSGFIPVGERPRYYPDGGKALLMSLKTS